jgi:hypothetical protein
MAHGKIQSPKKRQALAYKTLANVFGQAGKKIYGADWTGEELSVGFIPDSGSYAAMRKRCAGLEKAVKIASDEELESAVAISELTGDAYSPHEETREHCTDQYQLLHYRKALASLPPLDLPEFKEKRNAYLRQQHVDDVLRHGLWGNVVTAWYINERGKTVPISSGKWREEHNSITFPEEMAHKKYRVKTQSKEIYLDSKDSARLLLSISGTEKVHKEIPPINAPQKSKRPKQKRQNDLHRKLEGLFVEWKKPDNNVKCWGKLINFHECNPDDSIIQDIINDDDPHKCKIQWVSRDRERTMGRPTFNNVMSGIRKKHNG